MLCVHGMKLNHSLQSLKAVKQKLALHILDVRTKHVLVKYRQKDVESQAQWDG